MTLLWRAALIGSLTVVLWSAVSAQTVTPDYLAIVEAYRAGDGASIAMVGRLTAKQINEGIRAVEKRDGDAAREGRPRRLVQAAAMLHLERALAFEGQPTQEAFEHRLVHEDAAATLIKALSEPPRGKRPTDADSDEAFLLGWFRFRAAHDMGRGQFALAAADLNAGRRQVGDDPELLLAEGALHELAWRMEREEARSSVRFSGDLAAAERALQSAVEADPALDEARVRLGRVQTKSGKPENAVRTLAAVAGPRAEAGFVYLARLFEGDAYDALHDGAHAEQAYAAAIDVVPSAQSARLALAHLLFLSGKRDNAAQQVVGLAVGAQVEDARDPWVFYRGGVAWRAPGYLDVLRVQVRR